MRKLKTLLILMFAACLSFTLFACGGGDDDEETGKALNLLSGDQIELTDADTQDTFNTKMQTYKLTGRNDEGRVDILGSECDITGTINFGEIDRYTVTFKPRENNENGITADVVVVIDHDWGAPDATGKEVCSHDGATRITKDEDIAIHYGGFHYGTGASTELGRDPNAETALPKVLLTEEQASNIGLHAENSTAAEFKDAAGINEGVTSSGRIKAFGKDERANKVVPTLTAGDLAPGMSITIEGYAKTDVVGATQETPGGPWNTTNGNWNAPSYGIADPYSPLCTEANAGINVGTAVIVRSEGWVLYNGIGQEIKNTLGGLPAFVEGGGAYGKESGSTEKSNCASWDRATKDFLTGQDVTNRPAYTSSDWKNWWVYSEGQDRHSLDSYQSFIHVRVTWSYRTYGEGDDQVGIIVIDSDYLDEGTTFRSYIKVPAATRGSYRTIIHGDYSTLLITKTAYVETETVTDMQVKGLKDGAKTEYLAGEQIDAASVFDMQVKSEQNTEWHNTGIAVTNDMLYYYKGTGDYAQATTDVEKAEDWEAVGDQPLATAMKYFKIVLERADDTFHRMVPEAACSAIKITANNVAGAVADEYSTNLNSRDPMATYTRTRGEDGDTTYVDLTITKALFRVIPSEEVGSGHTFDALTDATDYRFTAIRILGIGTAAFDSAITTEGTAHSGTDGTNGAYYYSLKKDGNDVLLVVAIKKEMRGHALTIDGVQDTDVRITFGTGSLGFDVTSSISTDKPMLNAGGAVTITYKNLPSGNNTFALRTGDTQHGAVGTQALAGAPATEGTLTTPVAVGDTGVTVTYYKVDDATTTITFQFPAFNFATWATMPCIRAMSGRTPLTEDYIEYDLAFTETAAEATAANQSEGGAYFYAKDGTLYFVTVAKKITAAGEKANLSGITGGITANINSGSADTAKSFNLGYKYSAGTLAFADESLGDGCALKTIILEKAYGDYGVIAVASVDIAKATGFAGDFGFQINGVEQSEAHYWKYNATDKKIEYAKIKGAGGKTVITPGDCYTTGIVASEVKDDDKTVFLAEYTKVGGQHVKGSNGKCELCGATIDTKSINVWASGGATMYDMEDGDVLDMTMTYPDSSKIVGAFACYGVVWTALANGHRYWTLTDGQMQKIPDTTGWGDRRVPYDETERPDGEHDMWTSLPYNVLNGQVRLDDGTQIDTTSEANFKDFLGDATVRYIATLKDGTLTMVTRYFKNNVLAYEWEQRITITSGNVQVGLTIDPNTNTWSTANTEFVLSNINKSVIDEVEAADVTVPGTGSGTTHTASENVTFATAGFDADGNAKITATGMAAKQDTTYYIAFRVTFSQVLADTTTAALFQADGTTAYADGYVNLNSARTELSVYVPVTATTGSFLIKFTNFKASTMQSDIVVDLGALGVSDVGATLTATGLNLGESTFTIEYTGVQGTDKLVIGATEKTLSEIGTTDVDLGNGLKVKADTAIGSGSTVTLTFTKAAADLTKAIPGYEIRLMRGTALVAINEVAPATKPASGDTRLGQDADWYARATGTTLYLYANKTSVDSLPFNVNAGHVTDVDKLGVADLGFTVEGGVVKFENYSTLRSAITAVYTENGTENSLTVFVIDLTGLGVEAATPYGFAIEDSSDKTDKYYTVAATTRTIAEVATDLSTETDTEIKAHTKTENGIKARIPSGSTKDNATYYGYVTVSGHTFPTDGGECTGNCGVTGWQKAISIGTDEMNNVNSSSSPNGYDPAPTEKFGAIYKGQTVTIEGTMNTSGSLGYANMRGFVVNVGGLWIRNDVYIEQMQMGEGKNGDYDANSWHVVMSNPQLNGGACDWNKVVALKVADAYVVVTIDWSTAANTIVVSMKITGTNGDVYTQSTTITPKGDAAAFGSDIYEVAIIDYCGKLTGTITATGDKTVVDSDHCNMWLRDPAHSDPDYTNDEDITGNGGLTIGTVGTTGAETGWPAYSNNPDWIGKLEKGKKIVISGTQKSAATQPYWASLTFFVWSGYTPADRSHDTGICMDHVNNNGGGDEEKWTVVRQDPVLNGGTDFATLIKEVGADCTVTITFDWTQYNKQFSVTMKLEKDSKSVEVTHTFTEDEGQTMLEAYNIGIGVDHSYANLTSITRTTGSPTSDLPGLVYDELAQANTKGIGFTNYIQQGETLTFTGAYKDSSDAWKGLNVMLFTGVTPAGMVLRNDRYVDEWGAVTWGNEYQFDHDGIKIKMTVVSTGTFEGVVDGPDDGDEVDDFEKLASLVDDCTFEIKLDYTQSGTLTVTYKVVDANGTDYVLSTYTITATNADTKALPTKFNVKIGAGDASVVSDITLNASVTGRD